MERTLTLAALTALILPGTVFADAIDVPSPAPCPTTQLRHRLLLPFDGATDVPVNASIWAVEDATSGGAALEVVDTTTDQAIMLEASYRSTAIGVVVQFAPSEALATNRTYEVRNAGASATQFTTGSARDDVAPRAPSLNDGYAQYLSCNSTFGLSVFVEAEQDTLTFARRTDGALIGFSEPSYPLTLAGEQDTEVEFRAFSIDLAGNASDDSATRRETLAIQAGSADDVGCTCVGAGRAGLAAGLLLLPLLLRRRRV